MSTRRYAVRSVADIGRTIAEARRERGLTQEQLASQLGIHRTYLARLENGQSSLQLERILQLLRKLGVTVEATLSS